MTRVLGAVFLSTVLIIGGCVATINPPNQPKNQPKNTEAPGKAPSVPDQVEYLEIWSGGTLIASYENAGISIKSMFKPAIFGKDINFFIFDITANGKTESYIFSEALTIRFW